MGNLLTSKTALSSQSNPEDLAPVSAQGGRSGQIADPCLQCDDARASVPKYQRYALLRAELKDCPLMLLLFLLGPQWGPSAQQFMKSPRALNESSTTDNNFARERLTPPRSEAFRFLLSATCLAGTQLASPIEQRHAAGNQFKVIVAPEEL